MNHINNKERKNCFKNFKSSDAFKLSLLLNIANILRLMKLILCHMENCFKFLTRFPKLDILHSQKFLRPTSIEAPRGKQRFEHPYFDHLQVYERTKAGFRFQ